MKTIDDIKKEYFERMFSACFYDSEPCDVIILATYDLDDVKDIILETKEKFNINQVMFYYFDSEKMKDLLDKDLSVSEIKEFIPEYTPPKGNVKSIYFFNDLTDKSKDFTQCNDKYYYYWGKVNKKLCWYIRYQFDYNKFITVCPNKIWAKSIYGSEDRIDDLWNLLDEIIPSKERLKIEVEKLKEKRNKLRDLKIHNLYFYTNLGTDFKISLTKHSLWLCEPEEKYENEFYFNFPSYEIFTSPNCYSAEGKIVISKKHRSSNGILVDNASLSFLKGKVIKCDSNSDEFNKRIFDRNNYLNRIGEVAIVSQDSPLTKNNMFYDSILLDENTGSHIALGNSYSRSTDIPRGLILENGLKYYRHNESKYHEDLVFGNESTMIEAETFGKKKILLMENGKWKI